MDKFREIWVNTIIMPHATFFFKCYFRNPTPDDTLNITWPKVSKAENSDTTFLNICKTMEIKQSPSQHCYLFWESLFKNYGIPPFSVW